MVYPYFEDLHIKYSSTRESYSQEIPRLPKDQPRPYGTGATVCSAERVNHGKKPGLLQNAWSDANSAPPPIAL